MVYKNILLLQKYLIWLLRYLTPWDTKLVTNIPGQTASLIPTHATRGNHAIKMTEVKELKWKSFFQHNLPL